MPERTPLVLLPGLLCDAALWAPQVAELSDIADCRIIVLNEDDTMAGMAHRVLDQVPETFALAGLSMGGYCAFEIMRQAPDRVSRLALLDTSHEADPPDRRATRLAWIDAARAHGLESRIPAHMEMYFHPDHLSDAALVATASQSARNIGLEAYARQLTAIMNRADSSADLAAISCPTLVLCGREDMATPLHLHEAMASAIKGADLQVVEHCGHLSTLEKPAEVNEALRRWLHRDI